MAADQLYTAEEISANWNEIGPGIEAIMQRVGNPTEFSVAPGSQLAADDAATNPFWLTTGIRMGLVCGADHLLALKRLVVDGNLLPMGAVFTLARGALENLAAAYWLMESDDPAKRATRGLRWWAQNAGNQYQAMKDRSPDAEEQKARVLQRLAEIAPAEDASPASIGGFTSTEVVSAADSAEPGMLFLWRLCSGYAHGRPWAVMGASDMEHVPGSVPGGVGAKLTARPDLTLHAARESVRLLTRVLRTYERQAGLAD